MSIYMIQNREHHHIKGLWTDLDKLLAWVSERNEGWSEATHETDLDIFMKRHRLWQYRDGGESGKIIEWETVIPME